ncbi:Alcohol dehydrogenase (EC [Olavius algarvensis Delta 1 endosymbiont]|nr:Alcohol dehydrogenase (EC [Olavius algarvensis Delta 1 endosymbiont]
MALAEHMKAAVLTGHGGFDQLVVRNDFPVPKPDRNEVLIEVGACGINNTDINTRIGWYSKSVSSGTTSNGGAGGIEAVTEADATWGGRTVVFPRIQGADVAGRIVVVGNGVPPGRVGERVIVDPWIRDRTNPQDRNLAGFFGSERDGGFAQYTAVPAENAFAVKSSLSDAELASFPCSYSTAEHMLDRIDLQEGETILIPGASGGVGSALVQLAQRRKAGVLGITSKSKMDFIRQLGACDVFERHQIDLEPKIREASPGKEVDAVADIVGGADFVMYLDLLARGGRYVTAGAIAGPMVELDLRTLYLKDLTLYGATVMPVGIFKRLVGYIEKAEIRPLVAKQYPIDRIKEAQAAFLDKQHVGNFIVLPWK